MNPILFLIPLLLVVSVPTAFAQIVETEGDNYDLIEDYFIGEATWQSHPDRIMNGQWENYVLTNTNDKVIFNTNSVGSFIFDKNSCSYSIYENGYNGANVIPSVSAMASFQSNGVWSNLPVNDEACTVTVSEDDDGIFLTSTKVITETVSEDVFISYTGTTENFYGNGTNNAFTLQQFSNGTNMGYYNGEVTITEGAVIDKFTQELRLDIRSGFKETFKVIHDGDEPLGITQTIHTGESITIGDTTINIAELNGQSFDRQYIIDNKAEILQLTDSINYDFDTGIDSLSNVNIIFDGDYKVNMDYASGDFVGYLEIDPTFAYTQGTTSTVFDTSCNGSGFGIAGENRVGSWLGHCGVYTGYWDITSIPDEVTITDTSIFYDVDTVSGTMSCDWYSIEGNLSTMSTADSFNDGQDGTQFVQNEAGCSTTGNDKILDIGGDADADLQPELSVDNEWGSGQRESSLYGCADLDDDFML